MRRFKKIAKWTFLILLLLVTGLTITVLGRQNLKYEAPYPTLVTSSDSAIIARGRHLVYSSAHCIDCHSTLNSDSLIHLGQEVPLTGGIAFRIPVGTIYSKNITPDKETGIGNYSDAEIARSLRYGVHPDGTVVFDFMPFHNTSDEDLTAILSYLRSQKSVTNIVPDHALNGMGKLVKAFLVNPAGPSGEVPKSVVPDTTAVYGRYLAMNVAECSGCHTKRDLAGKFVGEPFAGGANIDGFITPNLTPHSGGRIFSWSREKFIGRFRQGKLIPNSPMPWNSFGRMKDEELTAIYNFLKTVKPARTKLVK
ncbi:cytochrome c [Flavitalea flava]